jgi:hypothetical protein
MDYPGHRSLLCPLTKLLYLSFMKIFINWWFHYFCFDRPPVKLELLEKFIKLYLFLQMSVTIVPLTPNVIAIFYGISSIIKLLSVWIVLSSWIWHHVVGLTFHGLHGVISQKIVPSSFCIIFGFCFPVKTTGLHYSSFFKHNEIWSMKLLVPPTLNQALANQHGPQQLQHPLLPVLPSDNVPPTY